MLSDHVVAAVIDNGFALTDDLDLMAVRLLDFASSDIEPEVVEATIPGARFPGDEGSHGARAAGTIAALAGGNTQILLCRVTARGSAAELDRDAANAVRRAVRERAVVVYFGWASYEPMPLLSKAIADAADSILFVAPAGNGTGNIDSNPVFPAAFAHENLLTVTHERLLAVGARADDVGHGYRSVDTLLVGLGNFNYQNRGAFALGDTSGAAAAAAGLALELAKRHRDWRPARIKSQLLSSVECPQDPALAAKLKVWTATGGFLRLPG